MAKYLVDIDLNYNQLKSAVAEKVYINENGFYKFNILEPLKSPSVGQVAFDLTDNRLKYCCSFDGTKYTWRPADTKSAVDDVTGDPDDPPYVLSLYGISNRLTNTINDLTEVSSTVDGLTEDVSQLKTDVEELDSKIRNIAPYVTIEYTGNNLNIEYDPLTNQSILKFMTNDIYMKLAELYIDGCDTLVIKKMTTDQSGEALAEFTWNGNSINSNRVKLRASGRIRVN